MTYEETRRILNILFSAYPATYKDWGEDQYSTVRELWAEMFARVPYKIVAKAVKTAIAENRSNFAPSIGEIMHHVKESVSKYDAENQWEYICYIVRNVSEGIPSHVRKLDEISRELVNSNDIQRFKNTAGSLDRERPHFIAQYNRLKDKREADAVQNGNLLAIASEEKLAELNFADMLVADAMNHLESFLGGESYKTK